MTDARKQAEGVEDPQEKRKIFQEAQKKIQTEVLTEEQRKKLREARKKHRPGKPKDEDAE